MNNQTFQLNIGIHNNCEGNCISRFYNKEELELRKNIDCGSLPGDSATCDKCGTIICYDGNFWSRVSS